MFQLASTSAMAALTLTLILAAPVTASAECPSPTGKVIFSDTFKDGDGGWETDSSAAFKNDALTLTLAAHESDWTYVNNGFDARDADYCVEAVLPKAAPGSKNGAAVGLALLYADDDNYTRLQIFNDRTIQLARVSDGEWTELMSDESNSVQPEPGSVVTLRATVKDGLITAYVNGVEVKRARVKIPDGALQFGVTAETDKDPGVQLPFVYKKIQVSALP